MSEFVVLSLDFPLCLELTFFLGSLALWPLTLLVVVVVVVVVVGRWTLLL